MTRRRHTSAGPPPPPLPSRGRPTSAAAARPLASGRRVAATPSRPPTPPPATGTWRRPGRPTPQHRHGWHFRENRCKHRAGKPVRQAEWGMGGGLGWRRWRRPRGGSLTPRAWGGVSGGLAHQRSIPNANERHGARICDGASRRCSCRSGRGHSRRHPTRRSHRSSRTIGREDHLRRPGGMKIRRSSPHWPPPAPHSPPPTPH